MAAPAHNPRAETASFAVYARAVRTVNFAARPPSARAERIEGWTAAP